MKMVDEIMAVCRKSTDVEELRKCVAELETLIGDDFDSKLSEALIEAEGRMKAFIKLQGGTTSDQSGHGSEGG